MFGIEFFSAQIVQQKHPLHYERPETIVSVNEFWNISEILGLDGWYSEFGLPKFYTFLNWLRQNLLDFVLFSIF